MIADISHNKAVSVFTLYYIQDRSIDRYQRLISIYFVIYVKDLIQTTHHYVLFLVHTQEFLKYTFLIHMLEQLKPTFTKYKNNFYY